MRIMCLTHSSMPWRFLHPSVLHVPALHAPALHTGCQSTCVLISVPCHCKLIAGHGQGSRCSVYPISCLEGSITGLHTVGVAAFDCVGSRQALLGQPHEINGHLQEWGLVRWVDGVL